MTLDQVINPVGSAGDPAWHFRVDIRSDAGASWLISGEDSQASADRGNVAGLRRLVGRPERDRRVLRPAGPDRDPPRARADRRRAHPVRNGRARPVPARQGRDRDRRRQRRRLHAQAARRPTDPAPDLGRRSATTRSSASSTRSTRPRPPTPPGAEPPFDSSGPRRSADVRGDAAARRRRAARHQRARDRGAGWPTGRRRRPRPAGRWPIGVLVSFSTQIGPVYLRVDQLGLAGHADTMTPAGGAQPARPPGRRRRRRTARASPSTSRPEPSAAAARSSTTRPPATTSACSCCGSASGSRSPASAWCRRAGRAPTSRR